MNRLNWLFTLSTLNVFLVTIERFSFTTKILLPPYNFLRLHEVLQMTVIILFTVLLPFFMLKEITHNFETVKKGKGFWLFMLFIIGIYFYATGNGLHEVSSFNFNTYCDTNDFSGNLCGGFFINDYYTGNILYFFGGILMIVPLLLFEKIKPTKAFSKKEFIILLINAVFYSLAIFAYAAFDKVLVGLIYSAIITVISLFIFYSVRNQFMRYPVITYTTITYTLGTLLAYIVRMS